MDQYREKSLSCEDWANTLMDRLLYSEGMTVNFYDYLMSQYRWTREKQSFYGFMATAHDPDIVMNMESWATEIKAQWGDKPEHFLEHCFGNDWTLFEQLSDHYAAAEWATPFTNFELIN